MDPLLQHNAQRPRSAEQLVNGEGFVVVLVILGFVVFSMWFYLAWVLWFFFNYP